MTESAVIRCLINNYEPREKPDDRFYEALKDLRAIGNNLNQLARKANSLGFIDETYYKKIHQFDHLFQQYPSLLYCEELKVLGEVLFDIKDHGVMDEYEIHRIFDLVKNQRDY